MTPSSDTTAKPRYTDEQRAAITMRQRSVAISAGAGCGKTFVLTERFLAALAPEEALGPESQLHQLVAITFTDRAAREMRDRVREKLYERQASAVDSGEAANWQRLIRDLDAARISTFHSFCTTLLRNHAVDARLDPQFTVLDQAEANTLLTEVIDDRLRELLATADADVLDLVYFFQIQGLRERVRELASSAPRTELEAWQTRDVDEFLDAWDRFHKEHSLPEALRDVAECDEASLVRALLAEAAEQTEKVLAVRGTLEDLLGNLTISSNPAGDLREINETAKVAKVGSKKAFVNEADYEAYRDACAALRKRVQDRQPLVDFDREADRPLAELGKQLLAITLGIREQYDARKLAGAQLEFDDLMQRTHQLLSGPRGEALCEQLGKQIDLLMVDEFQDTDPVQDGLVRMLCGDELTAGKLFFVGDFKQSIYKFRGARPDVFKQLQEDTPDEGRLPLSLNFRSQPAILEFVNALFHDAFDADYIPLRAHRKQVATPPAVEFMWAPAESSRIKGNTKRAREVEAEWIARRIRALIDEEEPLIYTAEDSPPRPVRPGDVAILFRGLTDVGLYEQALRKYGLDYYLVGGHAFYAQQEVFDLLNLLRVLASTCDQVSMAGVLRSPFFGLTDETLFWLSQSDANHQRGDLYAGLFADSLADEIDAEQQRQVRFAAETLRYLAEQKDRMPVAELVGEAIARTGYDAVLLTEFMGERKLANLHKLMQMARNFDRVNSFGLPEFITQITEFVTRDPKEAPAATQAEDANVVRLMTIHQAKGLEFPVVVIADTNRMDKASTENVTFHSDLGVLLNLAKEHPRQPAVSGLDLFKKWDSVAEKQERDRLLYVAATRAADYLVLSSSIADVDKPESTWLKRLGNRFDLNTGELREELPPEYATPQIRVTMEPPELQRSAAKADSRRQLKSLLEETQKQIKEGTAELPPEARILPPRDDDRREYSFSRLKGQFVASAEEAAGIDSLSAESGSVQRAGQSDGARLGTLVHDVLAEGPTAAQVSDAVGRHADDLAIPADSLRDEAVELATRFLDSDAAKRIAGAADIHREIEFLLAWPPEKQGGNGAADAPRLRGFIDCLYQDSQGSWHIVDYKTNHTTAEGVEEVAAQYEMQMLLYGLAVEVSLGIAPASLTLCFLRPGVKVEVSYDDDAKLRLRTFIGQAIAAPG